MNTGSKQQVQNLADWLVRETGIERTEVAPKVTDYAQRAFFGNMCTQLREAENPGRARHLIEGFRQLAGRAGKYGDVIRTLQDVFYGKAHKGLEAEADVALRACGIIPPPTESFWKPTMALAAAGKGNAPEDIELCGGRLLCRVHHRPSESRLSLATDELSLKRLTIRIGEDMELPVELHLNARGTKMLAEVHLPPEAKQRLADGQYIQADLGEPPQ
jgi:hypothetical protein